MDEAFFDSFSQSKKNDNSKCLNCSKSSLLISDHLGLCVDCIRNDFEKVRSLIKKIHRRSREKFDLPPEIPDSPDGIACNICSNKCRITEGKKGYCGIRTNTDGVLTGGDSQTGMVEWYHDPIPTNCVSEWVCPASTDAGFPIFTKVQGVEFECNNLAVFYSACNYNCLFCQNWQFRESYEYAYTMSSKELADRIDDTTTCLCFFGGDPTPQLLHAIETAKIAMKKRKGKVLRICWETNGSMNPELLTQMMSLSLQSGGNIKFDLKCWSKELHIALCGVSNERALSNFELAVKLSKNRPDPPPVVASTLLIPGYIDEKEMAGLSRFIALQNPRIPYSLLGFRPEFLMDDLPATSREHAGNALKIAAKEGLTNIHIGNRRLLGDGY